MWELDCEESRMPKNRCFWTVVLEKTLESPLDCKEIQPVHPKGDQSWVFIGRTDAEAEAPVLWPPHVKCWLIGKDPDAGRDWQEEKGTIEDEMAGWHHWLDGHGFGWTPGVCDGQGGWRVAIHGVTKSLTRLSDWTELNWSSCKCDFLPYTEVALMEEWVGCRDMLRARINAYTFHNDSVRIGLGQRPCFCAMGKAWRKRRWEQ